MHTSPSFSDLEQGPVTIRALSSLTNEHVARVGEVVAARAPGWIVHQHDDYDGHLSLLVSPPQDHGEPSYVISGTVDAVELAAMRDDVLCTLGRFENVDAALTELSSQLNTGV